jgi:hypothetical protein
MASELSLPPELMNAYIVLLKADSVRRIDHVIDYFGEVSAAASSRRAQIRVNSGEGSQQRRVFRIETMSWNGTARGEQQT